MSLTLRVMSSNLRERVEIHEFKNNLINKKSI